MKNAHKILIVSIAVLLLSIASYGLLLYRGVFSLNSPSPAEFPIRGVDVSSYQGDINWELLASQNIQFAFIKATEGSSHVDSRFITNYSRAAETDLRIGAYHFFSYDSKGLTQAENFISVVYPIEGMLPPVIDVEFYGDKESNLPDRETTRLELSALLHTIEDYYGVKPILYATEKSYRLYIAGSFDDYDIWIRNVFSEPTSDLGRNWTFWQYTNRAQLEGYIGEERFIDMNVFQGTEEEFQLYKLLPCNSISD